MKRASVISSLPSMKALSGSVGETLIRMGLPTGYSLASDTGTARRCHRRSSPHHSTSTRSSRLLKCSELTTTASTPGSAAA